MQAVGMIHTQLHNRVKFQGNEKFEQHGTHKAAGLCGAMES